MLTPGICVVLNCSGCEKASCVYWGLEDDTGKGSFFYSTGMVCKIFLWERRLNELAIAGRNSAYICLTFVTQWDHRTPLQFPEIASVEISPRMAIMTRTGLSFYCEMVKSDVDEWCLVCGRAFSLGHDHYERFPSC